SDPLGATAFVPRPRLRPGAAVTFGGPASAGPFRLGSTGMAVGGNKLTWWILAGLALGVVVGTTLNQAVPDTTPWVSGFGVVTTTFLRLIKMIIGPLVFATLAVGIAKMGDLGTVGRVGIKSLAWFMAASFMSLGLGLLLVNLLQPGVGLGIALP